MAMRFPSNTARCMHCIPGHSYVNWVVDAVDQESTQAGNQQTRALPGPVAILWDIENCPVPAEVRPEDVAGNIRMALQVHPVIKGAVTLFSAYGDFNIFPRRLREGCQKTGVNLIDVPNGKKDAADKAILVDMFLFALDNPPPCTILLISGDVDFAPALHKLGQRGYTVVLVIPAGVGVSSALCNAGRYVWDWPSVARGEGLIPAKSFLSRSPDISSCLVGFSSDDSNLQSDEETVVYRGIRQNEYNIESNLSKMYSLNSKQMSMDWMKTSPVAREPELNSLLKTGSCAVGVQPSSSPVSAPLANAQGISVMKSSSSMQRNQSTSVLSAPAKSVQTSSLPDSGQHRIVCSETNAGQTSDMWVQPGDLQGLKKQIVSLVNLYGGRLPLVRVPSEYHKAFGRPLYLAEYDSYKLVNLIKKMYDVLTIEGKGCKKFLCLRELAHKSREFKMNSNFHSNCSTDMIQTTDHLKNSAKGKEIQEYKNPNDSNAIHDIEAYSTEANVVYYSDEGSDDERGSDQYDEDWNAESILEADTDFEENPTKSKLEVFKLELQELLVSHACKILFTSFLTLYQQRYGKDLEFRVYGVQDLQELIEIVRDIAIIREEQDSKTKFVVANCSYIVKT